MATKEERIQFNRQSILHSAEILFAQKGISQTSVDDIAAHANCSKSTLYVYFNSKEDIYYSIVYKYMSLLCDGIKSCISQNQQTEECYYAICNLLTEFGHSYPLYFDCMLGKISVSQQDFEKLPVLNSIYSLGEEINAQILIFLQNAIAEGYVEARTPLLPTVFVFWSCIGSLISISEAKEEYLGQCLSISRGDFLHYGFSLLLHSIQNN